MDFADSPLHHRLKSTPPPAPRQRPGEIPTGDVVTDWKESAGFRETFLRRFPQRQHATALRVVSDILFEYSIEVDQDGPDTPESRTWEEVDAAEADIRHVGGFLAAIGRERGKSEFFPADFALATLAAEVSEHLFFLAGELRRALAAGAPPALPAPAVLLLAHPGDSTAPDPSPEEPSGSG